jgi:L-seryl-tRNA(Ser) seleniumtransferase
MEDLLRSLPSIERLLARPLAERLSEDLSRERVRDLLREITARLRIELKGRGQESGIRDQGNGSAAHQGSNPDPRPLTPDSLLAEIERRLEAEAASALRPSLRRVVNATGVIIHTNLGRAPLARAALDAINATAAGYSNLEYDIEAGRRGRRESHCQQLLARLAASEDAVVVNNNAAAVLLVLNTLAEGGEVIVSRGELVEIGGSFRIPEVCEKSGARMREVGTTNRTRIEDYERAINESTRLILRVHPSNYRIIGFTERPSLAEIAELARRRAIATFEDLGSGCLTDMTPYGVTDEPVVADSLRAGISVVSFSGDKMMGGPQAGIIAGAREIISKVRRNPLMRALRADKLAYAALEATLRLYERDMSGVPVIRSITRTGEEIGERAARFSDRVNNIAPARLRASLEEGQSVIGGGSAPGVKLPTVLVALVSEEMPAESIEQSLRRNEPAIITRTERERVLVDLRTVAENEEDIILDALRAISTAPNKLKAGH